MEIIEWQPNDLIAGDDMLKWLRKHKAKFKILKGGQTFNLETPNGSKIVKPKNCVIKRDAVFYVAKVELK